MVMNNSTNGFLFDVNSDNFSVSLERALKDKRLFVAAAQGKVSDIDLLSKLYIVEQEVRNSKNYDVKIVENYLDNGDSFMASVSFLPTEKPAILK